MGGLNLRSAYISSIAESIELLTVGNFLSGILWRTLISRFVRNHFLTLWTKLVFPHVRSKALALSTSLPHAGDWLNVVPSPANSAKKYLFAKEIRAKWDTEEAEARRELVLWWSSPGEIYKSDLDRLTCLGSCKVLRSAA